MDIGQTSFFTVPTGESPATLRPLEWTGLRASLFAARELRQALVAGETDRAHGLSARSARLQGAKARHAPSFHAATAQWLAGLRLPAADAVGANLSAGESGINPTLSVDGRMTWGKAAAVVAAGHAGRVRGGPAGCDAGRS